MSSGMILGRWKCITSHEEWSWERLEDFELSENPERDEVRKMDLYWQVASLRAS